MAWRPTNQYGRVCSTMNLPQDKTWEDYNMENLRIRLNPTYLIAGKETAPSTGKKHFQIYFELGKKMQGQKISRIFYETFGIYPHMEASRGSPTENKVYCSKEDNEPFEFGEMMNWNQGQRNDLIHMVDRIKEGASDKEILEEHPSAFIKHHKAFAIVRQIVAPKRTEPSRLFFIWGPTGNGKTTAAMSSVDPPPECVDWEGGRFLQGYTGSNQAVLFDDFDWAQMRPKYFLRLVDRWPMTVSTKGSFVNFGPKTILFTSNDDPRTWWPDAPEETRAAFHRRIQEFGEVLYLESKLPVQQAQHLLDRYFRPAETTDTQAITIEDTSEEEEHSQPSQHELRAKDKGKRARLQ